MGKWLLGIIILAIVSGLLAFFGPWSAKAASTEMGQSINAALKSSGHDFAKANMVGNVAHITGTAPSNEAAAGAITAAQNADCKRCKDRAAEKRWHVVSNDMKVTEAPKIPTQSPYSFNARKTEDGRIILNGYVADEAERQKVLGEAERLFPGKVTDRTIRIALGEPNKAWPDVVDANLADLALLEVGEFDMKDDQTVMTGRAKDEATRDKVNAMIANLPSGYEGSANISVPNVAAKSVGEVKDQSICQRIFNDLKGDTKLNFASAKAEIRGAESFNLLNTLADAAKQCASFRIQIDGHTDSEGNAAYNQNLSERRAQTVVAYLRDHGVETDRINATGYGETKPVASNDNAAGMAQNRRIEFTVSQAN